MRIVWSPLALKRVQEIAEYIAQDNPGAPETWVDNVFSKVGNFDEFPEKLPALAFLPSMEKSG